jgi:H/ACA ribonucleoprotein complex subunit 4
MVDLNKINNEKPIQDLLNFSIIILDKPAGPTSFKAIENVGRILGTKKVGHFGTLDPMVTGVLPIALNRACRLSNFFMHHDKEYIGKMQIHKEIGKTELQKEMDNFLGVIMQKPPVKSRVKRVLRPKTVNKFKILEVEGKIVGFHADVEAGTYIRKLVSDLGEKIGGAHMIKLRRIRAGIFKEEQVNTIEKIKDAFEDYEKGNEKKLRNILIPAEIISEIYPEVQVKEESVKSLLNGKPLMKDDVKDSLTFRKEGEMVSIFSSQRFIGIYEMFSLGFIKENVIIASPKFVLS